MNFWRLRRTTPRQRHRSRLSNADSIRAYLGYGWTWSDHRLNGGVPLPAIFVVLSAGRKMRQGAWGNQLWRPRMAELIRAGPVQRYARGVNFPAESIGWEGNKRQARMRPAWRRNTSVAPECDLFLRSVGSQQLFDFLIAFRPSNC